MTKNAEQTDVENRNPTNHVDTRTNNDNNTERWAFKVSGCKTKDQTTTCCHSISLNCDNCRSLKSFKEWILRGLPRFEKRKVAHSVKFGIALGVVGCVVLIRQVHGYIGKNVLWAVLTVVTVFESTVGATLSKGFNRTIGTIFASLLGLVYDNYVDTSQNPNLEPYLLGCTLFALAALTTYLRFIPYIKAKFDYGIVMFLLTFSLVSVSGYQSNKSKLSYVVDRIFTIFLGGFVAVVVSMFIFPAWAGEDFHNLICNNFEDLAFAIEGCTKLYFHNGVDHGLKTNKTEVDKVNKRYYAVITSKFMEESLANFASWEPWHGHFGFKFPWRKCLEAGNILRHAAYSVSALHGCITSDIQAPMSLRTIFLPAWTHLSEEVVQILREIGDAFKECRKTRQSKEEMLRTLNLAIVNFHMSIRLLYTIDATSTTPRLASNNTPRLPPSNETPSSALKDSFNPSTKTNQANDKQIINENYKEFVENVSTTAVLGLLVEVVTRVKPILEVIAEIEKLGKFEDFNAKSKKRARLKNLKRYNTEKLRQQYDTGKLDVVG